MFTLKYALNYIEIKNHNLGSLLPTIVAFIIHIQPIESTPNDMSIYPSSICLSVGPYWNNLTGQVYLSDLN